MNLAKYCNGIKCKKKCADGQHPNRKHLAFCQRASLCILIVQNHIAMSAQRPAVFVHHHSVPIVGRSRSYNELAADFDEVEYIGQKKKTDF